MLNVVTNFDIVRMGVMIDLYFLATTKFALYPTPLFVVCSIKVKLGCWDHTISAKYAYMNLSIYFISITLYFAISIEFDFIPILFKQEITWLESNYI